MDKTLRYILCVLLLAAFACSAEAIRCYECNTRDNNGCDDPFSDAIQKTGCAQCVKIKGKKNNIQGVQRDCLTERLPYDGCESGTENGFTGDTCVCATDLCNTSDRTAHVSMFLMALASFIATQWLY
ncbi:protein quiver-like [Dreissena polymorpha]|uniref:Protein quiver n=1 Tax=Dreissena polymorpha TaxID=45954 RepID=A0A9D4FF84_DREPO|nr:protein quiver-like [Dreissena polymorpha]KAH3797217.1 hypothetical protein DPMN_150794 [Dreissena polymorpha]